MTKSTQAFLGIGVVGLSWILMKIRSSIKNSVPLGYEDEAGFHFGVPMKKE
jgi:hypothetical protein